MGSMGRRERGEGLAHHLQGILGLCSGPFLKAKDTPAPGVPAQHLAGSQPAFVSQPRDPSHPNDLFLVRRFYQWLMGGGSASQQLFCSPEADPLPPLVKKGPSLSKALPAVAASAAGWARRGLYRHSDAASHGENLYVSSDPPPAAPAAALPPHRALPGGSLSGGWQVVRGFCPTEVVAPPPRSCQGVLSDRSCQVTTFRRGALAVVHPTWSGPQGSGADVHAWARAAVPLGPGC